MKFIEAIKLVLSLFPVIVQAVKTVEEMFPAGGLGAEKLAIVREMLEAAYAMATDISGAFEQIWPTVQKIIDTVVGIFNRTGVFRHEGTTA